jgi:hypothetical protein
MYTQTFCFVYIYVCMCVCVCVSNPLSWATPYKIGGERSGFEADYSPSFFRFPVRIIVPPLLHTGLSPPSNVCDSPDQAAEYHSLGLWVGAAYLTLHLAGYRVMKVTSKR